MNKIIKSLYLSIIFSGLVYIVLNYLNYFFINKFLLIILLLLISFTAIYTYFRYHSPKYTKEEVIEKFNLPVKKEESLVEVKHNLVVENINKPFIKSSSENKKLSSIKKDVPKQDLSHKNYAEVFKTINQNIKKEDVKPISDSEILSSKKENPSVISDSEIDTERKEDESSK